ncbi:MAG: hypothetical protein ACHQ1E_11750, partial [Ktedonobacterales bacterium]
MARTHTPQRSARQRGEPAATTTARAAAKSAASAEQKARPARPPRYDFAAFEARWRREWEARAIYRADLERAPRPFYNLMMFPYPSAEGLHIGNVYA